MFSLARGEAVTVPFQISAGDGRALWHLGALLQFKATGEDTGGQFWLAEQTSAKGYASPLHRHTKEDELFVVLEGELSIEVDGTRYEAPTGAVTYAPRGLAHTFRVESPMSRFLILTTPAGFERWFFETGQPAEALTLPPEPSEPPDFGKIIGSLAAYGVEALGGPPSP
jgi:quercetin dioxygenase-like cupin family protein